MTNKQYYTYIATKLGSDPVAPGLNMEGFLAIRILIFILPLRFWKYAFLIVSICRHYHLCTCLSQISCQVFKLIKNNIISLHTKM